MDLTIFNQLHKSYYLKIPNKNKFPPDQYPKAQKLGLLIYRYFFFQQLQIIPLDPSTKLIIQKIEKYDQNLQIKEAYQDLFQFLHDKNTDILDFVGCIIALLGQKILSWETEQLNIETQHCTSNKTKLNIFFAKLKHQKFELKEYFLRLYYKLTINIQIAFQTAKNILKKYIKQVLGSQIGDFNSKMQFMVEWQRVKMNLKSKKNLINQRPYNRKMKGGFKYQLKQIFRENLKEITNQNNKLRDFDCIIQHKRGPQNKQNQVMRQFLKRRKFRRKQKILSRNIEERNSVRFWERYLESMRQNTYQMEIQHQIDSTYDTKKNYSKQQLNLGILSPNRHKNYSLDKNIQGFGSQRFHQRKQKLRNGHRLKIYTQAYKINKIEANCIFSSRTKNKKSEFIDNRNSENLNSQNLRKNLKSFQKQMENLQLVLRN